MDDPKTMTETPAEARVRAPETEAAREIETDAATKAWDNVRALALRQLDRFMSLEPKVLAGDDPDAIHDIRVASRRLQQVFDLLYPLPRSRETDRLRRRIRRARRALGEVRNSDVLLERLQQILGRKRAPARETWVAVEHYLRQRRADHFDRAVRKLTKVNLAVSYIRLRSFLSANGADPRHPYSPTLLRPEEKGLEDFFTRVTQDLNKSWQAFESQIADSHRDPRPKVIHGVRIAVKRLRYIIEVIHAFAVPGSAEAIAWLRDLQQHLGDWHDLEVLERVMVEMVARPEFLQEHLELAIGVEKLILQNRKVKGGFTEKYSQMTKDSAELARIKDWVSYLSASPSAAFTTA